jgi:hypothetical protein
MKAVVEEFSATIPDAFAGDAVAFLQTVYKDPRLPVRVRLDAAAKAARLERPTSTTEEIHESHWTEDDDDLLRQLNEYLKEQEAAREPK